MKNSNRESHLDEWECVLSMIEYSIIHRKRTVRGGRSVIELMTGLKSNNVVSMTMCQGVCLKDARRGGINMELVDKH